MFTNIIEVVRNDTCNIFHTTCYIIQGKTLMSEHHSPHHKNVAATLIKNAKNFKIFSCHLSGRSE